MPERWNCPLPRSVGSPGPFCQSDDKIKTTLANQFQERQRCHYADQLKNATYDTRGQANKVMILHRAGEGLQ